MCQDILREEGGFEYKKAIVESILAIITQIPESKEAGVHICQFEFYVVLIASQAFPICVSLSRIVTSLILQLRSYIYWEKKALILHNHLSTFVTFITGLLFLFIASKT